LPLRLTRSVFTEIEHTIGRLPAEQGGLLGGNYSDGLVTHYYFDHAARRTGGTYSPDHEGLNKLLKEVWNPRDIRLLGFVHTHPKGIPQPSFGDLIYARDILRHIPDLECLLLPIALSKPDNGEFRLFPYAIRRDGDDVRVEQRELVVEGMEHATATQPSAEQSKIESSGGKPVPPVTVPPYDLAETFKRVRGAYDLERLAHCRIIYVGAGGAASFIEDLARAGVGEHVLIDPDIVAEVNLATQQAYRRDIGRAKVECIAERIRDINLNAVAVARQQRLEEISDAEFRELAFAPLNGSRPVVTLLCGLTDNFAAQARVNRLALQLGLPSLCAQVYREGRAAEVTFTYPGVTPACHRCILSSRYKAYLEQGFKNDVTSDGTPIFATTRLNALKGFVTMAILHHGTAHARWGGLLARIANRNLAQIRMDPDLATKLGMKVFERVFGGGDRERILFDDVVWLPQDPDCLEKNGRPTCPDCCGTGDLRDASGKFGDTREMR
jgi:molybdopterin/thiamine biosynthesis adenylyltransferase